jgi:hypothetical protein
MIEVVSLYNLVKVVDVRPYNNGHDNVRIMTVHVSKEIHNFEIPSAEILEIIFRNRYNWNGTIKLGSVYLSHDNALPYEEYKMTICNKDRSTDYEFAAWPHFKLSI